MADKDNKPSGLPSVEVKKPFERTDLSSLMEKYPFIEQGDISQIKEGIMRVFIYCNEEEWGFHTLGVARKQDGGLAYGAEDYKAFEKEEWGNDFFDGTK